MRDDENTQTIEELEGKLTSKQLGFARSVGVEYLGKAESYRKHYATKNMAEKTILVEALKVAKHPVISLLIPLYYEEGKRDHVLSRKLVIDGLIRNAHKGEMTGDLNASNKALELLGKIDELSMFVERSKSESDNRHHHSAEPLRPFDEFLENAISSGTEEPPQKLIPN